MSKQRKILILGATGYVGRRLTTHLAQKGYPLRTLVRDRDRAESVFPSGIEIYEGDVLKPETIVPAFKDIDSVYYLIHSMGSTGKDFEEIDRTAALNAVTAAKNNNVRRLIYLGALGIKKEQESKHLRSRHEVGEILRSSGIPVTEFRAAVVVGQGSFSFEMIHHLVNRLPVMICPRWVITETQPIAIDDILRYLSDCLEIPKTAGRIIDVGGPDRLTYRDMMLRVAKELKLRRRLIKVPVLTPRLSSYWLKLVTPISFNVARALIEGLRSKTVLENKTADEYFDFEPHNYASSVTSALKGLTDIRHKRGHIDDYRPEKIDPSHLKTDKRILRCRADAPSLFEVIKNLGGANGWLFADWLWRFRGAIDRLLGGSGLRRQKTSKRNLQTGEAIDFWRIIEYQDNKSILLLAEMNVWGIAWLKFEVTEIGENQSRLIQTAYYYPRGLTGIFYWYSVYPIHNIVFKGMSKAIVNKAEGNFDIRK